MIDLHGMRFPFDWLKRHMLITGNSGSGKTHGVLKPLLRQILASDLHSPERRPALVVFDIKGDLLDVVKSALAKCGRSQDLIVVGIGPNEAVFNPVGDPKLTPSQITQMLVMAATLGGQEESSKNRGDDLFWATNRNDLLTSLVDLMQTNLRNSNRGPLTFDHIQGARKLLTGTELEIHNWIDTAKEVVSEASAMAFQEWMNLPSHSTRACVMASVGSLLAPWGRDPLRKFVVPASDRPELDLRDLTERGKVVVINAGQAENAEELWPACLLLKQALYRMALSRSRQQLNQERLVAVVIDEATRLLSQHNLVSSEHYAMEMARSNNFAFILAAQNLSGMLAVNGGNITDKIAALCGSMVFLANNCPATLDLAQRAFGEQLVHRRHKTIETVLPAPRLIPDDAVDLEQESSVTLVPTFEQVVQPGLLSRMKFGAAIVRLVDGSAQHIQCKFD